MESISGPGEKLFEFSRIHFDDHNRLFFFLRKSFNEAFNDGMFGTKLL